jgi:hypothetical protein
VFWRFCRPRTARPSHLRSSVTSNAPRKRGLGATICLAYIHLAHARLAMLAEPHEASHRLFAADGFMKAGASPREVFEALRLSSQYVDAVEKLFNPNELRVPAGSGRTSGEWTQGADGDGQSISDASRPTVSGPALSYVNSVPAASQSSGLVTRLLSWMANMDAAQLAAFALYAARMLTVAGGAVAAFRILFVPSSNDIRGEGEVAGVPGLRYSWNRDERKLTSPTIVPMVAGKASRRSFRKTYFAISGAMSSVAFCRMAISLST